MKGFLIALCCVARACAAPTEMDYYESLHKWESLRLSPYKDRGSWSVGIGHSLSAHHQQVRNYTTDEVTTFFNTDLRDALRIARREVRDFDGLPDDVQLVVVNVIFGVGGTGFHRFVSLRRALGYRAWTAAATELYNSRWYRQVGRERALWALGVLRAQ